MDWGKKEDDLPFSWCNENDEQFFGEKESLTNIKSLNENIRV